MKTLRVVGIMMAGLVLIGLWLNWPQAAFGDDTLFLDTPTNFLTQMPTAEKGITRERSVRVNWTALFPNATQLRLNLFDDTVLTVERIRIDRPSSAGFVWVGRVVGLPDSLVSLSVRDDIVVGSVRLAGLERFKIASHEEYFPGQVIHRIQEIDPSAQIEPTGLDSIVPQPSAEELAQARDDGELCEDGSLIDLLIAYTPAARDVAGGTEVIKALIDLRVSEMNTANIDSDTGFEWRLANTMEVTYIESGDLMTDLDRLRIVDDNYMDGVHSEREATHADLVNLLVSTGTDGACGLAYQMNDLQPWFGDYAFGISALDYAGDYSCSSLTMAHEFGHGMGNAHDLAHSGSAGLFPYSYGYQQPEGAFRTIMAYDCDGNSCPRINHWSNPRVQFGGAPTGVEYDGALNYGADVSRSMTEARQMVANFEPLCEPPLPTETPTITPVPDVSPQPTETPSATPMDSPTPTATTVEPSPSVTPNAPVPSPTATASPTTVSSTEPAPTITPTVLPTATSIAPTATRTIIEPMPYVLLVPIVFN